MKLDIYKRAEGSGRFSYLAVPAGEVLPDEVTSIDWEDADRGIEFDESGAGDASLDAYAIDNPVEQITAKGYAITSVNDIGSRPRAG